MFAKLALAAAAALSVHGAATAQSPGEAVFEARCKTCHEPAVDRAPSRADMAQRPQADIVSSLTSGLMKPMAEGLSAAEIQAVAGYVSQVGAARAQPATGAEMPQVALRTGGDRRQSDVRQPSADPRDPGRLG